MMKHRFPLGRTAAMAILLVLFAGSEFSCRPSPGGARPPAIRLGTPPTFVLAWNAPGGMISTLESGDGLAWRNARSHATTSSRNLGPAVAHDGVATWMLMWANGPEFQFKVGVGGAAPGSGITWEAQPTVGVINASAATSPGVAFGNRRWVAVYGRVGNQLQAVRSTPSSAASWEAPANIFTRATPPRPMLSTRAPALASLRVGSQDLFVLAYVDPVMGAVSATSADGLTWDGPFPIDPSEKDPALAVRDDRIYTVLSRSVGIGRENIVYKSPNGRDWTEIARYGNAPGNAAGPGIAFGLCRMLTSEQIGGALGGSFTGVSVRSAFAGRPCGCGGPGFGSLAFGGDVAVTPPAAAAPISVGLSGARTALAFASVGPLPDLAPLSPCLTQSGLLDRTRPPRDLVTRKTTLVRATVRSRDSNGQAVDVDEARLEVVDKATGQSIASVQGFAFASDNVTQLAPIGDGQDVHFFVPGAQLLQEALVRFDIVLRRGPDETRFPAVFDDVQFRRNPGIALVTVSYDQNPPSVLNLATELIEMSRIYPVADDIGGIGDVGPAVHPDQRDHGVRFAHTSNQPLAVSGSLNDYLNEFVLVNVTAGTGPNAQNQPCAADVPTAFLPGRSFTFNFTSPEDLDGTPGLTALDLSRCAGNPSPQDLRFNNFVARLDSRAGAARTQFANAFPNDKPKFGVSIVTFGNMGQYRTLSGSGLGGQCPTGLQASRLCWAAVGINAGVTHHELGHAFGLDHNDQGRVVPVPAGPAYHLLNQTRIPNPVLALRGNVPGGLSQTFLLGKEYDAILDALLSPQFAALADNGNRPGDEADGAARRAAFLQIDQSILEIAGRLDENDRLTIDRSGVHGKGSPGAPEGDEVGVTLLDDRGQVLYRTRFSPFSSSMAVHPSTVPERDAREFEIRTPWYEATRTVVFDRGGRIIHRMGVSVNPPTVSLTAPAPVFDGTDPVLVRWSAADPDGDPLTFDVQLLYQTRPWLIDLASGIRTPFLEVAPSRVAGGEGVRLRVTARDGFHAATAESPPLSIPNRAPEASIVSPGVDGSVQSGGAVTFRAVILDPEEGRLAADRVRWTSDRDGPLGLGSSLTAALASPGPHTITVEATDNRGATARATIKLQVRR